MVNYGIVGCIEGIVGIVVGIEGIIYVVDMLGIPGIVGAIV